MQAGGYPRPPWPHRPKSNKRKLPPKEIPTDFNLLIKTTVNDVISKRVKQENYNPSDVIEYVYGLKSDDADLKEEVVDGKEEVVDGSPVDGHNGDSEEPKYTKRWRLDSGLAELWETAMSAECNADVDLPKPDDKEEKVRTAVAGHFHVDEGSKKEGISLLSTDVNLTHTVQLMYTLAQVMQLQPDEPEAQQLNAALEAMGTAEFFIKRLRAKQEAESVDDSLERRLQLHSWETAPDKLWDQKQLQHNKVNLMKTNLNKGTHQSVLARATKEGPKFFCELCNLGTSGQQAFDDHLAGKTHVRKQMASFGVVKTERQKHCDVCDVMCSDEKCYQAHVVGQKHIRVMKLKESLNLP